jgi:hypothetical protein
MLVLVQAFPPLAELARYLDIEIRVGITANGEYGSLCPSTTNIRICTDSDLTFLHEFSHATVLGLLLGVT